MKGPPHFVGRTLVQGLRLVEAPQVSGQHVAEFSIGRFKSVSDFLNVLPINITWWAAMLTAMPNYFLVDLLARHWGWHNSVFCHMGILRFYFLRYYTWF